MVVCYIRNQVRAKSLEIISTVQASKPLDALLKIGEPKHHNRLPNLRTEINRLTAEGILGTKKYSIQKINFWPVKGHVTLPWFDVHQDSVNFLIAGELDGQKSIGTEPAVQERVQD